MCWTPAWPASRATWRSWPAWSPSPQARGPGSSRAHPSRQSERHARMQRSRSMLLARPPGPLHTLAWNPAQAGVQPASQGLDWRGRCCSSSWRRRAARCAPCWVKGSGSSVERLAGLTLRQLPWACPALLALLRPAGSRVAGWLHLHAPAVQHAMHAYQAAAAALPSRGMQDTWCDVAVGQRGQGGHALSSLWPSCTTNCMRSLVLRDTRHQSMHAERWLVLTGSRRQVPGHFRCQRLHAQVLRGAGWVQAATWKGWHANQQAECERLRQASARLEAQVAAQQAEQAQGQARPARWPHWSVLKLGGLGGCILAGC